MTLIRQLLVVAALAATGSAFAADTPGAYILAAGGTSKYDDSCAGTTSCDTTGNSFKFVGGYRLGNSIAVEGVVLDFGKAKVSVGSLSGELKTTAYGGGVALYADTGPWLFNARLGIASIKAKQDHRCSQQAGQAASVPDIACGGTGKKNATRRRNGWRKSRSRGRTGGKGGGSLQRQANLCELDRTWCGDRHVVKDDHFMCDGGGRHAGECAKYDTHGYHGKRRCSECGDSGFGAGED